YVGASEYPRVRSQERDQVPVRSEGTLGEAPIHLWLGFVPSDLLPRWFDQFLSLSHSSLVDCCPVLGSSPVQEVVEVRANPEYVFHCFVAESLVGQVMHLRNGELAAPLAGVVAPLDDLLSHLSPVRALEVREVFRINSVVPVA